MQDTEIIHLFKTIYSVIKIHGVKNIVKRLQQLEEYGIDHNKIELIETVIGNVCSEYGIGRNDLFKLKKGHCAEARKMCYVLLFENANLSRQQIAVRFNRDSKVVYRAIDEYRLMNGIGKWEADFLKRKMKIEGQMQKLLSKQKGLSE